MSIYPDAEGLFRNFDFLSSQHFSLNGIAMADLKMFNRVSKEFKKAIKLDQNIPGIYYNLGVVLSYQNKYDEAIEKFEKVIEIDLEYKEAYNN
jgi:tetratricopeptide (TPR) repeat protein